MGITCTRCGYVVETTPGNKKLIETIQDWIRFSLRVQQSKGANAKMLTSQHIPCPQCGHTDGWRDEAPAAAPAAG